MAKLLIKGQRFGSLIIINRDYSINKNEWYWSCRCDCGNLYSTTGSALRLGRTIRCKECKGKDTANRNFKHGHSALNKFSPTYYSWCSMLSRVRNKNIKQAKDYSGRGIKVCDRWLNFNNFLNDMGERPENTSLDRINNDGNYEPRNCRWADRKTQNLNRRTVKQLELEIHKLKIKIKNLKKKLTP